MNRARSVHVIGAGGHGKVIVRALLDLGYHVAGIFDDNQKLRGTSLLGVPIIGPIEQLELSDHLPTVIAIGNNILRHRIAQQFTLEWLTVVDSHAIVDSTARLGEGTMILQGAVIGVDAYLGDHVIINTSSSIAHDCHLENFVHVAPGVHLAGNVTISMGAFLGIGAVAIPGISVGAWSTVGAGAAITRDLPEGVVAVGVPARIIKESGNPEGTKSDKGTKTQLRRMQP